MFPGHNEENMKKTLINAGLSNEKYSSKIIYIFKTQKNDAENDTDIGYFLIYRGNSWRR